jgi:PAS domain S-box-containing protein
MRLTLFAQFTLLTMLGASVVAVALTIATTQYRVQLALDREAANLSDELHALIDPILTVADFRSPAPQRRAQIEQVLRERVLFGRTDRASLLRSDGLVLYSTDPSLDDQTRSASAAAALEGRPRGEFASEPGFAGALVLRSPALVGGQVAGVYEVYRRVDPTDPDLGSRWYVNWLGAIAGVSLLFLLVLPLVRRISQLLTRRAEENARLIEELELSYADLGRALEAASGARERLTLLAAAVEGSAETILISDTAGRILYANPAAHDTFGYDPSELTGQNVRMFQPPGRRPLADEVLRASAEGVWQGEVNVLRRDGSELPVHLTASVVRDEGGGSSGVVALVHDLSEERRRQEELIQARSQAAAYQRGESLKSELISIVSHELRTPLTALQGFSELLLTRDSSSEESRLWTRTINEEAKRLAKILDDLLNVSRIEGGAIRLNIVPTPIEDAIQQVVALFSAQSAKHHFVLDVEETNLAVSADRERLTQILDNLLSNAVKYMPAGGTIRIAVHQRAGDVIVAVSDEGLGIPAEEVPKLFTRFHRVDTPDRVSIRGTGLGLYITSQLVAMHGGTISVESEVGRGTTFTVTLPLASRTPEAVTGAR